jgi:uncharacterized protein YyaL (SSP411 family)
MALNIDKLLPSAEQIASLPPDGGPEFNRLIHEKSPYLLQHARNPVDWYPWCPEAFEKARQEDKPIFLSIGYSSCHWCHVMEEDSFDNREVADILNRYYVSIKVDREERPDIDEIYMNATQLMMNGGGWPNSLWLLPDGRPWYAGTFFPREDIKDRPGFKTILLSLAEFWRHKRREAIKQAEQLTEVIRRIAQAKENEPTGELSRKLVSNGIMAIKNAFDERYGGFGGAPKFPPHSSLDLLFYEYPKTEEDLLLNIVTRTLDGMMHGGIHDHIGGGFHRYSVDAEWLVPHFEKMLYDNAMLARSYVQGYYMTGNRDYREVASRIFEWIFHEMTDKAGGFYTAIDADSEGVEGKFYLWSYNEVIKSLDEREGGLFCRAYNILPEGNFREEATGRVKELNIPHRTKSYQQLAEEEGIPEDELIARLEDARRRLLAMRNTRVRPLLDDKVLAACNGLTIGSLAFAGHRLQDSSYIRAAERAARFVLRNMRSDGRLLRSYRGGEAKLNAYLDDYAFMIDGLLDLYESTNRNSWLEEARKLMHILIEQFYDEEDGGFYFTSKDHPELLTRLRDPLDKAVPSGNGVAARALVRLGHITGEHRYLDLAKACFEAFQPIMDKASRGTESLLLALAMYFDGRPPEEQSSSEKSEASVGKKPVKIDAFVSRSAAAPGETVSVAVKLSIEKGWHINSNKPFQDYLIPTSLQLQDSPSVSLGEITYPIGRQATFSFDPEPISIYEGTAWIVAPLKIAKNAETGKRKLELSVRTQACDDENCLVPEQLEIVVPLEVSPEGGEEQHQDIFKAVAQPVPAGKGRKRSK